MEQEYRMMFDEVHASERLRQEVQNMIKQDRREVRRHISKTALIAAIIAALLAGTALAASFSEPGNLQDWFQQKSDTELSEFQIAAIDRLTQEIGISDSCNGIMLTVDSITVGRSSLWILVKVDGLKKVETEKGYHFGDWDLAFVPEWTSTGPGGYGYSYSGAADDGRLTFLLNWNATMENEESFFAEEKTVRLQFKNLKYKNELVAEGSWDLCFTLKPLAESYLTLESAQVPAKNRFTKEIVLLDIRDICISPTDIQFMADQKTYVGKSLRLLDIIKLLMDDGTIVDAEDYSGMVVGDVNDGQYSYTFYWDMPVDLSRVAALQIGDTVIPLG